jgi:hypothetical protein
MIEQYKNELIGKEVRIYPGDTYKKQGVILDINDHGVLFRITYYAGSDHQYRIGKKHFISYSASLIFAEI